jgi:hypothetical protein
MVTDAYSGPREGRRCRGTGDTCAYLQVYICENYAECACRVGLCRRKVAIDKEGAHQNLSLVIPDHEISDGYALVSPIVQVLISLADRESAGMLELLGRRSWRAAGHPYAAAGSGRGCVTCRNRLVRRTRDTVTATGGALVGLLTSCRQVSGWRCSPSKVKTSAARRGSGQAGRSGFPFSVGAAVGGRCG